MNEPHLSTIFLSHSSVEGELASYVANWLEQRFKGVKCFCSTRPPDLPPGKAWFEEIKKRARNSTCCLSLVSPDSVGSPWIQFESGLITGSGDEKILVPTLYGGVEHSTIPSTLRGSQYLRLDDIESMEAFLSHWLLGQRKLRKIQRYADFVGAMPWRARRLMNFGEFGLLATAPTETATMSGVTLNSITPCIQVPREAHQGILVAIRVEVVPRRVGPLNHWKFGIKLSRRDSGGGHRHFQFHGGSHHGVSSWTIYVNADHHTPMNVPATLHLERSFKLQLWLSGDGRFAACVGCDINGVRSVIRSDTGEEMWRLESDAWDEVRIEAWADGEPFRVDVESLETDRAKTVSQYGQNV